MEGLSNVYIVGYCLRHPAEQQGALKFLSHVEEKIGWPTEWIGQELERQWMELAAVSSKTD